MVTHVVRLVLLALVGLGVTLVLTQGWLLSPAQRQALQIIERHERELARHNYFHTSTSGTLSYADDKQTYAVQWFINIADTDLAAGYRTAMGAAQLRATENASEETRSATAVTPLERVGPPSQIWKEALRAGGLIGPVEEAVLFDGTRSHKITLTLGAAQVQALVGGPHPAPVGEGLGEMAGTARLWFSQASGLLLHEQMDLTARSSISGERVRVDYFNLYSAHGTLPLPSAVPGRPY